MTADLIISNARLVLADDVVLGTVRVAGGRIAAVDTSGTGVAGALDLDGDYLMPGLV